MAKLNVIIIGILFNFTFALVLSDSSRLEASVLNVASDNDVTTVDVTSDDNETVDLNKTSFECKGPSKDELRLYAILSWWMDAVGQVRF